jgi:hypothetical protein
LGTPAISGGYAHAAYLVAVTKFIYTSAEHPGGGNWIDPTLYGKYAWINFLKAKYPTVADLNNAWGTGGFYTSFDDAGGFGAGTGVIDEDGRHTAWMGTSAKTLSGASAGVVTDLNAFLYQFALKYTQVVVSTIRARDPNHLIFSPDATSNYGEGMRPEVVQGFRDGGFNVLVLNYDPSVGPYAHNMVNNNAIYDIAQLPAILWYSVTSNHDSAYSNFIPSDAPEQLTQDLRGQHVRDVDIPVFLAAKGAAHPDNYVIGYDWWGPDGSGGKYNWGLWSRADNAYDGMEDVTAGVPCGWGLTGKTCGGEAANHGNFISYLIQANNNIYPAIAGAPLPSLSPCDVNGDGMTNVADVQLEVNMALGISPCTNPSGVCTVVSVQRVVNAALGGQCVAP